MGTNYYWHAKTCPYCGHKEKLHVGKSSPGHVFTFRGYKDKNILSFEDWKTKFKLGGMIKDSTGTKISISGFVHIVKNKKWDEPDSGDWLDSKGFTFLGRNFV